MGFLAAVAVAAVVAIILERTGLGDLEQHSQVENRELLELVNDVEFPEGFDIVSERIERIGGENPFRSHVIQRVQVRKEGGGWFASLAESLRAQGFSVEEYPDCVLDGQSPRLFVFVEFKNVPGPVGEVECPMEIGDRAIAQFVWSLADDGASG